MNHLESYPVIAFSAAEDISAATIVQIAKDERCTAIYIVGTAPNLIESLRAFGVPVHEARDVKDVPAHAFKWFQFRGFWATFKEADGTIGDMIYAQDNLSATRALLNRYAESAREAFSVHPVSVTKLDIGFPNLPS